MSSKTKITNSKTNSNENKTNSNENKTDFNQQISNIFLEEFNDCFHNIFVISQTDFIKKFIHRVNSIIKSYYPFLLPFIRKNSSIFAENFRKIFNDYYLPIKSLSKKINSTEKKLTNFQKHCELNEKAFHSCLGEFYIIKSEENKEFLICSKCKYIYNSNNILMYCSNHDTDFYSKITNSNDEKLLPATWLNYHCPVILNQQMICPNCNKNYLFIDGFQLFCYFCNKHFEPYSIDWICIICKKTFNSGVKIYNNLEYFSINFAVKNAIVNNLIIKPLKMECNCEKNTLKLNFFHNKNCDGVLLEGHIFEKKIVVCKKCKIFASVNKYKWLCPLCGIKFKCLQTRSLKEIENDEFNVDVNVDEEENLEEKKNKIKQLKTEFISEKFIKSKIINKIKNEKNENKNDKNEKNDKKNNKNDKNDKNDKNNSKKYLNNLERYKNFFKMKNLNEEDKNDLKNEEKYHIKRPSKIIETDLQNYNSNKEKYEIKRPSKIDNNLIEKINKINNENNDFNNNNNNEKYHIRRPSKLLEINDDNINKNYNQSKSNRYEMNKNIYNLFTPVKKKFNLNNFNTNYKTNNNNNDNNKNNDNNNKNNDINIKLETPKNNNNNNKHILSKSGVININEYKKKFENSYEKNKKDNDNKNYIINRYNEEEEEEKEEEEEDEKNDEVFSLNGNKNNNKNNNNKNNNKNYNNDNKNNNKNYNNDNKNNNKNYNNDYKNNNNNDNKNKHNNINNKNINNIKNNNYKNNSRNNNNNNNKNNNLIKSVDDLFLEDKNKKEITPKKPLEKSKFSNSSNSNSYSSNSSFETKKIDDDIETEIEKYSNPSLTQFSESDYNIITQLGEGTFGKIYLVESKETHTLFCLKKMITSNKKQFLDLSKEFLIFSKYPHPNILKILSFSNKKLDSSTYCLYILMEVGKTDWEKEINQRLIKNNFYSEKELINILFQLVRALNYLQKNNISHRDIKAQNVLVFNNNVYKIADFGEAKKFNSASRDILNTLRGTELYMSPILFYGLQKRIFDLKHNSYKSDVFSLGMCILFAATLKIKVLCKIREFNNDKKIMVFLNKMLNDKYSEKFVNLVGIMLKINENDRVDFIELEKILNEEYGDD